MPDRYPPSGVLAKLKRFDRDLDLRWCQDRWGTYYKGKRVGSVAPDLLGDGSMLLSNLYHSDIFRQHGSAAKAGAYFDRTEQETKDTRDRKRKEEFTDNAKEMYDDVARLQGRRINNAGIPQG